MKLWSVWIAIGLAALLLIAFGSVTVLDPSLGDRATRALMLIAVLALSTNVILGMLPVVITKERAERTKHSAPTIVVIGRNSEDVDVQLTSEMVSLRVCRTGKSGDTNLDRTGLAAVANLENP